MFEQNHVTIPIRPNEGGPMEILQVIVAFYLDSAQLINEDGLLHLIYNTLSENIGDTFTDMSLEQFHIERIIAHHLPLQTARWMDRNGKFHTLPIEWFIFADSSISASSTFSKILVDPRSEEYWKWGMLSLEIKWVLELPRSIQWQTLRP